MELNETTQKIINAIKVRNFHEVENLCNQFLKSDSSNPLINYNLAIALFSLGKLNEAQKQFEKVIELQPDYAEAYYNLGITLQKLNKYNKAEINFRNAIKLKPDYSNAYYNLGIILFTFGNFEEAEINFKKTLSLKTDFIRAHNNLGITQQKLNKYKEAEASFKKAITFKSDYIEAYYNLGVTLKKLGKIEEAKASYTKAIELNPEYKAALLNRGQIFFEEGNFELSLIDFDTCNNADSRSRALTSLYALGRVQEIYRRIEINSELDDENINVAAFAAFIAKKEKKETANNFCKNPLDFLNFSNLSSHHKNPNLFISEIIKELSHVKAIWEPVNQATHKGFQSTSNLFKNPNGNLKNLKSIILDELDSYYLKFKKEKCTYIEKWPSKKDLMAWHVILKKQGYQNSHIHSAGWLSGVIYLKIVPSFKDNEGAIEFGLNGVFYNDPSSPKLIYQPKLGDIVLFPSSLHHKTIPFSSDTDRISIAFDLMPKG